MCGPEKGPAFNRREQDMKLEKGGVCAPIGFMAAHTAGHIKYENRDDCAMIYSQTPCVTAATFTTNVVKAAPVLFDRDIVNSGKRVSTVVVNTGIANAATGKLGLNICSEEASAVKAALKLPEDEEVLVASTGVIGAQVPLDRICDAIRVMSKKLVRSGEEGSAASEAIRTTDTHGKQVAVSFEIGGKTVTIGAMAKGSGMIHPNMCTMLSFVMTDCAITKELLQDALSETVADTYNMISVDGDMSTNDSCFLLANGMAKNPLISEKDDSYKAFAEALRIVNRHLAESMAEDGEGATKLLECRVINADTKEHAKILAKSVIESDLTKAAVYGNDANWGRIFCALGYAGVPFDPDATDIYVGRGLAIEEETGLYISHKDLPHALDLRLVEGGMATGYDEEEATAILSSKHVVVTCDMKAGSASAAAYGCDLTDGYIRINADYRS